MTNDRIIDKIKKLLALSASPNLHEAESAAAQVQRLMLEYQISDADLREGPAPVVRLTIQARTSSRAALWESYLANMLGRHMNVLVLGMGGDQLDAIGRETDVAALAVLYAHLHRHLDRLARASWYALGHAQRSHETARNGGMARWVNTFHTGAREAIDERMKAQRQAAISASSTIGDSAAGSTTALARSAAALVKLDAYAREAKAAVNSWCAANGIRVQSTKTRIAITGSGAMDAGRRAGGSVSLSPSARALPGRR